MRFITILLLFFSSSIVVAQEVKPKGQFLADTIKIGEPVGYAISLKYPKDLDIVFPDSLYNFSPYEFEGKRYFPTVSDSTHSYDSAIYYISTFEIDSTQYLKMPVYVLHNNDSTIIETPQDSIVLRQLVAEVPDSVSAEAAPLIENTNYINVPLQFNYPYFIIGGIILLVVIILVLVFFGKRIKNAFILRKLRKNHEKFVTTFNDLRQKQNEPSSKLAESILIHWKKYLEKLENRPYTKLTTKEILVRYEPVEIEKDLKVIDRVIYANVPENNIPAHYDSLKQFAQIQFEGKLEEVKNG